MLVIQPHVSHAGQAGFDIFQMLRQQLRRDACFVAEHQLKALVAGFYRFRRELGDAGDKADVGRDHQIRRGIKDQARFAAERQQASLFG